MFENANSTAAEQVASGEQGTVVESPAQEQQKELAFERENRENGLYLVSPGQESAVDSQQDDGNGSNPQVGEDSGGGREPDSAGQDGKAKQSREENAAMRAMRLRAEAEAKAAEKARTDEVIAKSGGINPYTGKPFAGLDDFLEYAKKFRDGQIAEEAERSGRTVEEVTEEWDNRDFVRKMRQQQEGETQHAAAAPEEDVSEFLRRDVQEFVTRHPDVDVAQLENNPAFRKFCGTRFMKEPLADLYDDYLEIKGGAEKAAVARSASRAERSTGGGTTGGQALTPSQQSMLDQWNRENPEMAMTAKDFFRR